MTWFRFKACVKCGGDLVLDQPDWLCLQCGTYYYTGLYRGSSSTDIQPMERRLPPQEKTGAGLPSLAPRTPHLYGTATLIQGSVATATVSRI